MSMKIFPVSSSAVLEVKNSNFCRTCHSSWNCPPTGKEIKEGITEGKLYCLDSRVVFELNSEKFPRLVDIARGDKNLCGPKGRYWQPIREIRMGYESNYSRPRAQGQFQPTTPTTARVQTRPSSSAGGKTFTSTRKPYKVG